MAKKSEKKDISIRSSAAEYLTFVAATGDDKSSVEVRYEDENIWITQKMLATLYEVETNTINYHIKKIFEDAELTELATIQNFLIVQNEGGRVVSRKVKHYNLQMIIAVGFKVNSERAVQFRKWVNTIATKYTIKGFAMDDERLKNDGSILTKKYFEEQLERIREICSSERKFYQKVTDIYATAIDYDKDAASTKRFYATVQNKMHYAVNGHTVADLIVDRADSTKEHMGLTNWLDTLIFAGLNKNTTAQSARMEVLAGIDNPKNRTDGSVIAVYHPSRKGGKGSGTYVTSIIDAVRKAQ